MATVEQELARAAAHDAYRVRLSDALREQSQFEAMRAAACQLLARHLDVRCVRYARIEGETYIVEHDHRLGAVRWQPRTLGRALAGSLGAGRPLVVDDVPDDPRLTPAERAAYLSLDMQSLIAVPMGRNLLTVAMPVRRAWRADEVQILVETADRTWAEVERRRAEEELARAAAHGAYRLALADALRDEHDPAAIYALGTRMLAQHLGANRASFSRIEGEDIVIEAAYADGAPTLSGRIPVSHNAPVVRDALVARLPISIDDVHADSRMTADDAATYVTLGSRAFIAAPVVRNGMCIGVSAVVSTTPRAWRQDEIDIVIETAERVWVARQRAIAEQAVQRLLARDAYRLRMLEALRSADEPAEIIAAGTRALGEELGVDRAVFAEVDGDDLLLSDHCNPGIGSIAGRAQSSTFSAEAIALLRSGGRMVVTDADSGGGVRASLSIGLVRDDRWVAAMAVHSSTPRVWTDDEAMLLKETAERMWAALDRTRALTALREANSRKDEFLAMLSHELRNPLAPLRTGIDVLRIIGADPAVAGELLAIMDRQLAHLKHLVDDLLDAARITRGTFELRRGPVKLRDIVETGVEANRAQIANASLQLNIAVADGERVVHADSTRLVQALSNLVHNATKFTPPGGRIDVTAEVAGNELVLAVSDTGPGIAPDLRPRLFELFARGHDSRGLGIGLALVRHIAELHGGSVSVRGDGATGGSRFEMRIPLSARNSSEQSAPTPEPQAKRKIVVVDDNVDAARSIAMLVRAIGGVAHVAHDGLSGLALVREVSPDIVFLDIGMPGMDGYEVCRLIRGEVGPAMKIVALTGWGKDEDRQRAVDAGFDGHITKPPDAAILRRFL